MTHLRPKLVARRTLLAAVFTLSLVVLVGCGPSMRVTHGYDETVDIAAYQTFDWLAQPDDFDAPLVGAPELSFRIKRAIEAQFTEKGYQKVEEDPNFYVVAHAALQRQITRTYIDRWGYYYPPRRPGRWGAVVEVYDVGTLLVDVIDGETDELVWRGAATDVVRGDPDAVREQADEAVRRILAPFPSRRDLATIR